MKKLLYLTTTDWQWSKQRPQFLAEELSAVYDVKYVYHKTYIRKNISHKGNPSLPGIEILSLFRLPLNRFSPFRFVNKILTILQLLRRLKTSDIIWFSNPAIYGMVRSVIPENSLIVYDCIDDHTEFDLIKNNDKRLKEIIKTERDLIEKSDLIFVSSEYLRKKLIIRYSIGKKIFVINNAISSAIFNYNRDSLNKVFENESFRNFFKLVYTGTVSEWFDFELIVKSLKRFENIVYLLIGPSECKIPVNRRIIHFGPVPHEDILSAFMNSDALIMPFKLNELVYSVNPVKIYEYIFSEKPSLIPAYSETKRFGDFVFLYNSDSEYLGLLEKLLNNELNEKAGKESVKHFIEENTWGKRSKMISRIINETYAGRFSK